MSPASSSPQARGPLYARIAAELLGKIVDGTYPPNGRIPSEHELAVHFRVGRPTVRQATEQLVRRGVLERRRGSGTFVQRPRPSVDLLSLGGTISSFAREGLELRFEVVEPLARRVTSRASSSPFRGREALRLVRVGRVDDLPVLHEAIELDAVVFAPLCGRFTADGSLSRAVADELGLSPRRATQTFTVVGARGRMGQRLHVEAGHPLLAVERRLEFDGGRELVFSQLCCRTDRFAFSQQVTAS